MVKRKPTLIESEIHFPSAQLTLKVDADILDFSGHFKHFPILPGVTQIDWVLFYGVDFLNIPPAFKGMEVIKFQEPILPDSIVRLSLSWDEVKHKLSFKYTSMRNDEQVTHSSGKMKLGVPSE
ncbi:3-hydroxyacyl-ACP dehydratase [Vibrio amylolyticus]|uniref:ApeI family dehydratase n=1 Tax=Vibrio amylolyticus TaxID=2847292 RepID=UPI00354D79EE